MSTLLKLQQNKEHVDFHKTYADAAQFISMDANTVEFLPSFFFKVIQSVLAESRYLVAMQILSAY